MPALDPNAGRGPAKAPTRAGAPAMLMRIYLVAYFALVGAAVAVLWQGDVLSRLPAVWVTVTLLAAVALGALLACVSLRRPNPS